MDVLCELITQLIVNVQPLGQELAAAVAEVDEAVDAEDSAVEEVVAEEGAVVMAEDAEVDVEVQAQVAPRNMDQFRNLRERR